ncbi:MAG: Ku protein [Clostridia bacterium]|nr:Ku protein [Clostridia bacterium]
MAVAKKTMISFGLVAIPVAMYTAIQDNEIHFNQLYKKNNERIKYKKTCAHCGQEVTEKDIVKGYEYDKDHYVIITDEEIEKIKTEKEKSVQILHFAELDQISPVYYEKSYRVLPEAGGEKAFELLRTALLSENKVAIGKTVMGTKETLMVIIPREDGLIVTTMYYQDDIKTLPKAYSKPKVAEAEIKMAKTLINSMDTPFNPNEYTDEYQVKLRNLIEDKIAGKKIVTPKSNEPYIIADLMDALKESIEQAKSEAFVEKTVAKKLKKV